MQTISEEYRKLNSQLHDEAEAYGTSGKNYAANVMLTAKDYGLKSILDYGCGKNTMKNVLPDEYKKIIRSYDPAIPEHAAEPEPAELIVCTDVLEHIEPELLDNVLSHLAALMQKYGLLVVSIRPSKRTLADGRNAHLIVESPMWWFERMKKHFTLVEGQMSEMGDSFMVLVRRNDMRAYNA